MNYKENIVELLNIYLERIDAYKDYNAIIYINENALTQAEELDKERANGKVRSSIHGIPIIVKDNEGKKTINVLVKV